jgi:nucleotide-binding universal stress UspA family protein
MNAQKVPRYVIVAAIDESPLGRQVVDAACTLAVAHPGAEVHLLHVIQWLGGDETGLTSPQEMLEVARKVLEDRAAEALQRFDGRLTVHLAAGTAWREIVQTATNLDADLLVVGSRRLGRLERLLLGSVASQVVAKAQCPVFVMRPKEPADVPEIEPPCPDCLERQQATAGAELWCATHAKKRRPTAHTYSEVPPSFGVGSMLIRP